MSQTYKGFTLNTVGSPAPWAQTEITALKNIIATLVNGCCTEVMDTSGHKHYKLHASSGGLVAAEADSSGNIKLNGDIYSESWQSYTPTISGWGQTNTVNVKYKTIGKMVFVRYAINGIGNDQATEFTLPTDNQPDEDALVEHAVAGSGTTNIEGILTFVKSSTSKAVFNGTGGSSGYVFGNGETKWVCGQFWYHKA